MSARTQGTQNGRVLRLAPYLAIGLLAGPILAGFIGVLLPAFGYLPALGGDRFSLVAWQALLDSCWAWVRSMILSSGRDCRFHCGDRWCCMLVGSILVKIGIDS
mgnify:CR=1 FL=1